MKANDEVYILGDVTMKGASNANTVLSQLKGKKYLIKGNHDNFVEEKTFIHIYLNGLRIIMN